MTDLRVRVDERIAERRREVREQRRRRRLRRTLTVLVLLVLAAAGYAVERSPLVALSEVQVRGTERLAVDTVVDAADLPIGTSTLRLDLRGAEARVEALPMVRTARASRVDPLTVRIEVEERRPVLVAAVGTRRVLLDAEGVVVAEGTLDGAPTLELPPGGSLPALGDDVTSRPALAAAFRVQRSLPPALARRVPRVASTAADEVDLVLDNGVLVRFGRADRLDEKVRALEALLSDVRDVPMTAIDVRAPATPVVRP